jgi:hypothetical protein
MGNCLVCIWYLYVSCTGTRKSQYDDSTVGWAAGFDFQQRQTTSRLSVGLSCLLVLWYLGLVSMGLRYAADHSPIFSAEFKYVSSCISTSLYTFMV